MDKKRLYDAAVAAWHTYCKRMGFIADQPNHSDSEVFVYYDGAVIQLVTGSRLLAVYWCGDDDEYRVRKVV